MSETLPAQTAEEFGSNEWLVEELYEQYKADKNSVDSSWWPFFEKFEAEGGAGGDAPQPAAKSAQRASKPAAKAPAPNSTGADSAQPRGASGPEQGSAKRAEPKPAKGVEP